MAAAAWAAEGGGGATAGTTASVVRPRFDEGPAAGSPESESEAEEVVSPPSELPKLRELL